MILKENLLSELRSKLKKMKPSVGSWLQIDSNETCKILAQAGYNWLVIDMEHGHFSNKSIPVLCSQIESNDVIPLVRVSKISEILIRLALDAGAYGVVIPNVSSKDDIDLIKNASFYPPKGLRGVGFCSANSYGRNFKPYLDFSNELFMVGMIESKTGLQNLNEILEMKILDSILIGPYDLSASLGCTGDFKNKKFIDAKKEIFNVCKKHKVPCGVHIVEPDISLLKKSIDDGYLFIPYSGDSMFLEKSSMFNYE